MLSPRTHGYRMCARVSLVEGSGAAWCGAARCDATRRDPSVSLVARIRASLSRERQRLRGYERETAHTCASLHTEHSGAQFARLRHGRLVNSAARNQTPHTPSSRSCIPISPVGSSGDKFRSRSRDGGYVRVVSLLVVCP